MSLSEDDELFNDLYGEAGDADRDQSDRDSGVDISAAVDPAGPAVTANAVYAHTAAANAVYAPAPAANAVYAPTAAANAGYAPAPATNAVYAHTAAANAVAAPAPAATPADAAFYAARASDPRRQPQPPFPPALSSELPNPQAHMPRVNMKEDGKMFIGGLNWETSDDSLKNYFSQYGDVAECTVMRDGATGRSRGFGFLTFKDPKCVNTVMVKEHYLDGKIIDPKRAIPREEQDKTSKIFVGGVSQECTDSDFREYFAQFGRVLDATLMMDKDTGRPRGFGFVTFESDAAVENALAQPVLMIKEKQIEVKRATPKGGPSFGSSRNDFGNDAYNSYNQAPQQQFAQSQHNYYNGMSPAAMAQYYRQMQQYYSAFQQQMGRGMARPMMMPGMPTAINMQGMNPAMMGYGQQQAADQQYSMPDSTDQWANNGSVKSDEDISKVPANAPKGPAGGSSVGRGSFRGRGNFRGAGRGAPGGARFNPYGR